MRLLLLVLASLLATPALADIKFTRLDEDQFVISHRKQTLLGGEAKAMNTLYEEVASLCIAAGYEYFEVKGQDVQERNHGGLWGGGRGASGTIQAKFHTEDGEDFIRCEPLAVAKKIAKAKQKLAKSKR